MLQLAQQILEPVRDSFLKGLIEHFLEIIVYGPFAFVLLRGIHKFDLCISRP